MNILPRPNSVTTLATAFTGAPCCFFSALFFIALGAASMPANGQNRPENTSSLTLQDEQEISERRRILRERSDLLRSYDAQREACYQKLAVTPCLTQARDAHNTQMSDLKRQEVALSDVQRKRKAAERLRVVDERNSSQAQLAQAERRGRAMEDAQRREAIRAERLQQRNIKPPIISPDASIAASPVPDQQLQMQPQIQPPIQALGKLGKQLQSKQPAAQRLGKADKSVRSQQAATTREQKAAERRSRADKRETNRKKPAATTLPLPP